MPDARPLRVSCKAKEITSDVTPSAANAEERSTPQTPAITGTLRARGARLDLSPQGIIALKESGVSDRVLIAAQELTRGYTPVPPTPTLSSTDTDVDPPLTSSTASSRASGGRLSGSSTRSTTSAVAVRPSPSRIV